MTRIVAIACICFAASSAVGIHGSWSSHGFAAQTGRPELSPVFSDRFAADSRTHYTIRGDVSWKPGRWTLSEGASVRRSISGGYWSAVTLQRLWEESDRARPGTWRLWFHLEGATDCFVRFRDFDSDENPTASVAIVDTASKDGMVAESVVREVAPVKSGYIDIRVEYRRGVISVTLDGARTLVGYIANGPATVREVSIQSEVGSVSLGLFAVETYKNAAREYTQAEQEQLALATKDSRRVVQLYQQGRVREALRLGENVTAIRRKLLGKWDPNYAASLHNLAFMYMTLGDYSRARSLYHSVIEVRSSVLGKQHPDYGMSLNNLAQIELREGNLIVAERLYTEALEVFKTALGRKSRYWGGTLNSLGHVYRSLADYSRAMECHTQAAATLKEVVGETHPDYAASLVGLAKLYEELGEYGRAEPFYKRAIAIFASCYGPRHPSYATAVNDLGRLYGREHNYAKAVRLLKASLAIRKEVVGERHPDYGTNLHDLAVMYAQLGDDAMATALFRKALETLKASVGEEHPDYANCLMGLGMLSEEKGDDATAEELYRRALGIHQKVFGAEHALCANSWNQLGTLYYRRRDYGHAQECLRRAAEIAKRTVGESHPDYAQYLNNLGAIYHEIGDDAASEKLYLKSIEIRKKTLGTHHGQYAAGLYNLASLYAARGDEARAEPLYARAAAIQRLALHRASVIQSIRQQLRNHAEKRIYLDRYVGNALRLEDSERALEEMWKWKGTVTWRHRTYRRLAASPELQSVFQELQSVARQLSSLSRHVPIPPPNKSPASVLDTYKRKRAAWENHFQQLSVRRENLEQELASKSEDFAHLQKPLRVSQVREWLPEGTVFVDFLEYVYFARNQKEEGKTSVERRYVAWVVRSDRNPVLVELGSAEKLADAVDAFRRSIVRPSRSESELRSTAMWLREHLWSPLEKHFDGIDTVILCPDTILGMLPWNALPGKRPQSYVIEEYRVATLPMATMLRAIFEKTSDRHSRAPSLLVVGAVDYSAAGDQHFDADSRAASPATRAKTFPPSEKAMEWKSLPGFREELEIVRRLFQRQFDGNIRVLERANATEAAFLKEAPRFSLLHVVTHGFFASPKARRRGSISVERMGGQPEILFQERLRASSMVHEYAPGLLSGLVLAGANGADSARYQESDGILTASEIATIDLSASDLVVLSACETGVGKAAAGEGLIGLQRSFHVAGARTVIASLWKVGDNATLAFMKEFYRNLWEKRMGKLDALREAQLAMLRGYDPNAQSFERGLGRKSVKVDVDGKPSSPPPKRLSPWYWAPFQLSGDWR